MSMRKRLDMMAQAEERNEERINEFVAAEERREHAAQRLAYIEGYTTAKPGREAERDAIIDRYRRELELE
jgi:hypothetical protein